MSSILIEVLRLKDRAIRSVDVDDLLDVREDLNAMYEKTGLRRFGPVDLYLDDIDQILEEKLG